MSDEINPSNSSIASTNSEQLVTRKPQRAKSSGVGDEAVIMNYRLHRRTRANSVEIRSVIPAEMLAHDLAKRIVRKPRQAVEAHALAADVLDLIF